MFKPRDSVSYHAKKNSLLQMKPILLNKTDVHMQVCSL